MAKIKNKTAQAETAVEPAEDKTFIVSNVRVDRNGKSWRKPPIWIRDEYLGKLDVISHFTGKEVQQLVDEALGAYIGRTWDDSMAARKMVEKAGKK